MIEFIGKEKFNNTVTENKAFNELFNNITFRRMRGHENDFYMLMKSEDGTDFLQGCVVAETYKTKLGICCKLHAIAVAPECRNIGFGSIMLDNIEKKLKEEYGNELKIITISSTNIGMGLELYTDFFAQNGYEINEDKNGTMIYKEFNNGAI